VTWIDVSVPIRPGMVVFEGDPDVVVARTAEMADGAICNLSRLDLGAHTGTHIDAPVHFIPGAPGIDATPLDACIGPAYVADATHLTGHIDAAALEALNIPDGTERLLFKTRNSTLWVLHAFSRDFIGLREDAALEMVARGVRLVGIDYLSIAPFDDPAPTHIALLRAGVVILEGLDLRSVEAGPHDLIAAPLLLEGADGAPARALLRRQPRT